MMNSKHILGNLATGIYSSKGLVFVLCAVWVMVLSADLRAGTARSPGGLQAWTATTGTGRVYLTEVWIRTPRAGQKHLGTFPGWCDGLAFDGERLLYKEAPLVSPMFGVTIAGERLWPLSPGAVWVIPLDGEEAYSVPTVRPGVFDPIDDGAGDREFPASTSSRAALAGVDDGVSEAAAAYAALHGSTYRSAKMRFKLAGKMFKDLPKRFPNARFFKAPCKVYNESMKMRSSLAWKEGPRWVCREHMQVIGDLLTLYGSMNQGARPPDLQHFWDWMVDTGATEGDLKAMERLFTSSKEWEPGRILSYYYRPLAADGEPTVTSFFHKNYLVELVGQGPRYRVQDRRVGQAVIDSIMAVGEDYYQSSADTLQAIAVFEMVTGIAPGYAPGHSRFGYAYLKAKNLERAIRAFERAVHCDDQYAEAYCGLGLAFRQRPRGYYDAIRYFQKALQYKRDYVEARFNIAELRYAQGELDAKKDADKVIELDPRFAPVYLLMGMWYEDLRHDYENAALYYAQYMSLRPHDSAGRKRLGRVYLRLRNSDRILELLGEYVQQHPEEYELLPILAQACVNLESYDRAAAYYDSYVKQISPKERMLYDDITMVCSSEDAVAYKRTWGETREAYLTRFWAGRDPDLTTAANERKLEHYRRVWFSRQQFSDGEKPWDMRGEVYIKFGEPDYRSTSNYMNFEQTLEVQQVKERLANEIYGFSIDPGAVFRSSLGSDGDVMDQATFYLPSAGQTSFYPGPVFPVRSMALGISTGPRFTAQVGAPDGGAATNATGTQAQAGSSAEADAQAVRMTELDVNTARTGRGLTYSPVTAGGDPSMVAWESWVYTNIDGGIEITFTDESGMGIFRYAPVPLDSRIPIRQLAALNRHSPANVAQNAFRSTPDYYVYPENKMPLGFYYDLADFRGDPGMPTNLEVYTAIPHNMGNYFVDEKETRIEVARKVGALNLDTGAVFRSEGMIRFRGNGNLTHDAASFVLDATRMSLPPGKYRVEMQMKDRLSRRHSRYRQEIEVEDYATSSLRVSDLELAWRITEGKGEGKFGKGELEVVPMPTRHFQKSQSVYLYYEIYNLRKDSYGQTHYRVSYSMRPKDRPTIVGIVSSLFRLGKNRREQVAVTYEQKGGEDWSPEYVELPLDQYVADQYVLKVKVEDLNSLEAAEKEAAFTVVK